MKALLSRKHVAEKIEARNGERRIFDARCYPQGSSRDWWWTRIEFALGQQQWRLLQRQEGCEVCVGEEHVEGVTLIYDMVT